MKVGDIVHVRRPTGGHWKGKATIVGYLPIGETVRIKSIDDVEHAIIDEMYHEITVHGIGAHRYATLPTENFEYKDNEWWEQPR